MRKHFDPRTLIGLCVLGACLLLLPACDEQEHDDKAPTPAAPAAEFEVQTKSELYFGLSKPGGGTISADEWSEFLAKEVTPRFKEGLTVLDASGQWQNDKGTIVKEPSKVLVLIHPENAEKLKAIRELIESYKKRFQQESVLWIKARVEVKF